MRVTAESWRAIDRHVIGNHVEAWSPRRISADLRRRSRGRRPGSHPSRPRLPHLSTARPDLTDLADTRHHDGHVRQKALRTLLDGPCALQPWVVPYVVKLVDEYVVEIVDDVATFLTEVDVEGSPQQRAYGRVLAQNPEMLRLLRARATSYWDCCYRRRHRRLEEYPGHRLALALSRAAAFEGAPWPPPRP
jgi:hypothetical protein